MTTHPNRFQEKAPASDGLEAQIAEARSDLARSKAKLGEVQILLLEAAIGVERERLRQILGRAKPRGFTPRRAPVDQVDRMSDEDVLLLSPLEVFKTLGEQTDSKPSEFLRVASAQWDVKNKQALFWMSAYFDLSEKGANFRTQVPELLRRAGEKRLADMASAGVRKRHAPSRDAKALAQRWWLENGARKMTKRAAVEEMKRIKLVSETPETIIKWLTPKELASTGRS